MGKMKWVFLIYDLDFADLLEDCEKGAGDSLEGKLYRVLADPPYNFRNELGKDNASQNPFTPEKLLALVDLGRRQMAVEAHRHVSFL